LSIVMMAVSVYFLKLSFANQSFINAFAFAFGIGFGGAFTIIQVWVADLYAGTSFGAILGVVTMIDTIAGSAGMIILGTMRKNSGSYESGANLLLILCLISIVCAFLVKKPKENVV
jgi:MFS transporter, OFA family, oxalate/formate antiporter